MPSRRPRAAHVAERHDDKLTQILTTAAQLFAEYGYDATSVDMIAERVGIHKASLYHYVEGKESILFLCQSRSFADLEEIDARMADHSVPVLERLRLFVLHLARAQNSVFGRCLVMVGPKPLKMAVGGQIRQIQRRLDTIVRKLLAEAMETGALRQADIPLASAMLFGALNWTPRWYKAEGRASVEEIANLYVDILIDGLRPQGAASDRSALTPARPHRP